MDKLQLILSAAVAIDGDRDGAQLSFANGN